LTVQLICFSNCFIFSRLCNEADTTRTHNLRTACQVVIKISKHPKKELIPFFIIEKASLILQNRFIFYFHNNSA
jgi:hypothetical protein